MLDLISVSIILSLAATFMKTYLNISRKQNFRELNLVVEESAKSEFP